MVAPAPPQTAVSPLGSLNPADRELVIAALTARLAPHEAVTILTALAGTHEKVRAVAMAIQERAQAALLDGLPPSLNIAAVSALGIGLRSDEEYLEEILTEAEQADPAFRRRVEEVTRDRGIQRWLAAVKVRHEHMSLDEVVAAVQGHEQTRQRTTS